MEYLLFFPTSIHFFLPTFQMLNLLFNSKKKKRIKRVGKAQRWPQGNSPTICAGTWRGQRWTQIRVCRIGLSICIGLLKVRYILVYIYIYIHTLVRQIFFSHYFFNFIKNLGISLDDFSFGLVAIRIELHVWLFLPHTYVWYIYGSHDLSFLRCLEPPGWTLCRLDSCFLFYFS